MKVIPPYVRGSDTSEEAAASMIPYTPTLRDIALRFVARRGGATCDEIETGAGMRHQTASARLRELVQMGLIHDCGKRRLTRSGRPGRVYKLVRTS